jgi:DNA ligase-1
MLANKYDPKKPKKSDIVFPCFVQPKLDGLRCIMYVNDGQVVCQSRTGGTFETMGHIADSLDGVFKMMPDLILDGELYTTTFPFEELAGLIKKKKITASDVDRLNNVQYHVYDVVCDKPYHQRLKIISDIFQKWDFENVVLPVETDECSDGTQFRHYFAQYVERGYEGIMLRNRGGLYRQDYRSNDLQKYKEFQEDEYSIIGFKEADGRDKGTVIWICKTPEGREFSVRPRGTQEMRRNWFVKGQSYVGKLLTVIYQELSELNVPRFPVGKAIRDGY